MYKNITTCVRTPVGISGEFPNTIGLHQGSALSPYLFTLIIDEITKHIHKTIPECMLFADDIVLIDDTREGVNAKLEVWRDALESKGFKISRNKTEYMECHFSNSRRINTTNVKIGEHDLETSKSFKYLGSILQENGGIDKDVAHRIQVGWNKWRNASSILCDRKVPLKLKGKFYKTAVRPAMLYGSECWGVNYEHEQKMRVAEMRMLRWMCGHTRLDKIRNECIRNKVGVAPIDEKMRETRLRWFGHVHRRPLDAPVRRVENKESFNQIKRGRGRPKKTWKETIKNDMNYLNLNENMCFDRARWRGLIHIADPT
jgi:Reverse transcriptase (RNA-dependent DNA polymerase)